MTVSNKIGIKFGRLTVIGRAVPLVDKNGWHLTKWECLCDCGKKKDIRDRCLVSGTTRSCGCFKKEQAANHGRLTRKEPGYSVYSAIFSAYRNSAAKRGYVFDLNREQFVLFLKRDCHYCGSPPSFLRKLTVRGHSKEWNAINVIKFNGIDRKDNKIGYVLDNCLSCCRICNRAKLDMEYSDFVNWINRLRQNR